MEDDIIGIAKSVAENFDDEELRDTFVNISLDLYVCLPTPILRSPCNWTDLTTSMQRPGATDENPIRGGNNSGRLQSQG